MLIGISTRDLPRTVTGWWKMQMKFDPDLSYLTTLLWRRTKCEMLWRLIFWWCPPYLGRLDWTPAHCLQLYLDQDNKAIYFEHNISSSSWVIWIMLRWTSSVKIQCFFFPFAISYICPLFQISYFCSRWRWGQTPTRLLFYRSSSSTVQSGAILQLILLTAGRWTRVLKGQFAAAVTSS